MIDTAVTHRRLLAASASTGAMVAAPAAAQSPATGAVPSLADIRLATQLLERTPAAPCVHPDPRPHAAINETSARVQRQILGREPRAAWVESVLG